MTKNILSINNHRGTTSVILPPEPINNTHKTLSIEKDKLSDIKDVIQHCVLISCNKIDGGFIVFKMRYSHLIDPQFMGIITFFKDYLSLFKFKLAFELNDDFIINVELSNIFEKLLKEGFYFRMNDKFIGREPNA